MSNIITLYMIRHAPVIGQKGRIYGDDVEIDLNEHDLAISQLSRQIPGTDKALWFCSGVDRTIKTGESILKAIGDDVQKMKTISLFREQDFGDLIGKSHADAAEYIKWHNKSLYIPAPLHGEAIPDLIGRVKNGIHLSIQMALEAGYNSIVIICHRGTIRAANIVFNKLPVNAFMDIDVCPLSMKIFSHKTV